MVAKVVQALPVLLSVAVTGKAVAMPEAPSAAASAQPVAESGGRPAGGAQSSESRLPAPVAAMLQMAATTNGGADLDAVASVAKSTYPQFAAEISAMVGSFKKEKEESRRRQLAEQNYFEGWTGSAEAGFTHTTGNTDESGYLLQLDTQREGITTRHKVRALMDRQSKNGGLTRARSLANYQIDRKFGESISAYGLFGWERDRFAGYERRFTQSLGIGYRVLESDDMRLLLNAGPAFRQTSFVDGTSENNVAARGSIAYRWTILPRVTLTEDASVIFDTGSTIMSTTSLTTKLLGALSARVSYDIIHERDPLPGRQRTDTSSRLSLVYSY